MARQSNVRDQLMQKFKKAMSALAPSLTVVDAAALSDGSPAVTIKSGATAIAFFAIAPRAYSGFNVVAELSSSAAEGTPEHIAQLYMDTNASGMNAQEAALLGAIAYGVGCSSFQIYNGTDSPAAGELIASQLSFEVGASAMGAVGA
jgi:hypothetical protein